MKPAVCREGGLLFEVHQRFAPSMVHWCLMSYNLPVGMSRMAGHSFKVPGIGLNKSW